MPDQDQPLLDYPPLMGYMSLMPKQVYDTIKAIPGTTRLLRQLSFELDKPITKLVKELVLEKLNKLGVKPR